jgi:hypothetical protein
LVLLRCLWVAIAYRDKKVVSVSLRFRAPLHACTRPDCMAAWHTHTHNPDRASRMHCNGVPRTLMEEAAPTRCSRGDYSCRRGRRRLAGVITSSMPLNNRRSVRCAHATKSERRWRKRTVRCRSSVVLPSSTLPVCNARPLRRTEICWHRLQRYLSSVDRRGHSSRAQQSGRGAGEEEHPFYPRKEARSQAAWCCGERELGLCGDRA